MPYLIVESDYDPPVTDEQLRAMSVALTDCLAVRGVTRMRSWLSADRRRGFCEYTGESAESIREAYDLAKVKYARVWRGTLFEQGHPPDEG